MTTTASTTGIAGPADLGTLPVRSSRHVDLNLLTIRILSNREEFDGYAYFSRDAPAGAAADHEIVCVDLDRDPYDPEVLRALSDRTLRAKRFLSGYYLNHIFGEPAYLITEGRRSYVFGRRLERTIWPYFVKRVLTDFAVDHGYLHLKAAGFTLDDGSATLLVGPNAGGKTVFLTQACLDGARFLTNTHVLVRDGEAHAVPSAVRVRRSPQFEQLIEGHGLTPHLESGDFVAAPELLFPGEPRDRGRVRSIVITDYSPDRPRTFERIDPEQAALFLGLFADGVVNYGLKDDLLAHHEGDFTAFTGSLAAMREQLAKLVEGAHCYRANVDMLDSSVRERVLAELSSNGHRG